MLRKPFGAPLALCALLGACGSPSPSQPGPQPPTPTPAPTPTSAGFLHALQQPYVVTYEIDALTGRLDLRAAQNTGDTQMLASDPRGRYVYAAHYSRRSGPSCGGLSGVVTYAPNQHGMLELVSELTERVGDGWVAFSAGTTRLHSVRYANWGTSCRHTTYYYESVAVGGDGQLGEETSPRPFPFDNEAGLFYVDPRSDMLYKAGRTAAWGGLGGLAAHAIQQDGQLRQTGWTDLCAAATMPETWEWSAAQPLVVARGFLFASVWIPSEGRTLCSYQGPRLKPLADLAFNASAAEAFVPASESQSVLLAMGVEVPAGKATRYELRLFSMDPDGQLRLLDSEDLRHEVRRLLFHPSGRFLYVSDTDETLFGYALGPEGRLELIETIDQVGESTAITLPAAGS
jgi:hypothetical protein